MPDGRSKKRPGVEAQTERILEAALMLFAQKGSARVSIAELCRTAEVSRPTFYRCFEGKDQVLEALYDQAIQTPIRFGIQALVEGERDGEAVVGQVIDALFAHRAQVEFLVAEARDPHSSAAALIDAAHQRAALAIQQWQQSQDRRPLSLPVLRSLMVAWQWILTTHLSDRQDGRELARAAAWELARTTLLAPEP